MDTYELALARVRNEMATLTLPAADSAVGRISAAGKAATVRSAVISSICFMMAFSYGLMAQRVFEANYYPGQTSWIVTTSLMTGLVALAIAIFVWLRGTGPTVFVRGGLIALVVQALLRAGFPQRWQGTGFLVWLEKEEWGIGLFLDEPVGATVLASIACLAIFGTRGISYDGSAFTPVRYRSQLLIAATGLTTAAVLLAIAGVAQVPGGTVLLAFMKALPVLFCVSLLAITARGILRLRTWSVALGFIIGLGGFAFTLTADYPAESIALLAVLIPALSPLAFALMQAAIKR